MKIGKKITIFVVVLILVVAGGVFFLVGNLDSLVKKAIEEYGSEAAGTAVTVASVHIDLGQATGTVRELNVASPPGFNGKTLFRLGEVTLKLDPASLTGSQPTVDEIRIVAPQLRFEVNAVGRTNLAVFRQGVAAGSGTESGTATQPRLLVKKLTIADAGADIDLTAVGGKTYTGKLPPLTMTDLGGQKGVTPKQLGRIVMTALADQLQKEAARRGIDAALREQLDKNSGKLQRKLDEKLGPGAVDAEKALKKILGN